VSNRIVPTGREPLSLFLVLAFGTAAALPAGAGFLPVGTEVTELRDEVACHYSNGDGSITAVISAGPIHARDDSGNWIRLEETDAEISLPTFEYEYATGHASTDGTQYGKTGNGLMKVECEVSLQPPSRIERVGWAKFDLASLPEWARVTGASLYRVIAYFEMSMGLSYRAVSVDPVAAGARTLYEAIYDGEKCYEGDRGRLFDTVNLGALGVQHVQQSLSRQWVAFGSVGTGYSSIMTKRVWIVGWNNNPRAHSPWLLVTYQPPTAVAEPVLAPGLPALSISPNPVTDGFVTLRVPGLQCPRVPGSSIRVFDAAGRCVLSRSSVVGDWSLGVPLDLRRLSGGVYLVRLDADSFTQTQKFVVQR